MTSSIILVGNGASLSGKKLGGKIDEYDIIVRFNNFAHKGYKEDVGTRHTWFCQKILRGNSYACL